MKKMTRRFFIATGASVAAVGGLFSWRRWRPTAPSSTPQPPSPTASPSSLTPTLALVMPRLIRALGPWPHEDHDIATDFINRFSSESRLARYAEHEDVAAAVERRLDSSAVALDDLDLAPYTEDERRFVMDLARELYATDEVRAYLRGVPPVGTCIGNLRHHTLEPS